MELTTILNMAWGAILLLIGFILKEVIWANIKEMKEDIEILNKRISSTETLVAGEYVKRHEFQKDMNRVFDKLDQIHDRLSRKQDRQ